VIAQSPGALIHPWLLGSPDENDVQGYTGTPVNVNAMSFSYPFDIGAAGALFPRQGRYYVSVDSGRDQFTGRPLAGAYALWSWKNDVLPPLLGLITQTVSAGRPTIAIRTIDVGETLFDPGAGVDPLSLLIGYRSVLVGASLYDPVSGIAIFALPPQAPRLNAGSPRLVAASADFQESKNVATTGADVMPNTTIAGGALKVVNRPTVTWLLPDNGQCVARPRAQLTVLAGSNVAVRSVRFLDGKRAIGTDRSGIAGLYDSAWRTSVAAKGRHTLRAIVRDAKGRTFTATRTVRLCK